MSIDLARYQHDLSRRSFLRESAYGLGGMALAGLMTPNLRGDEAGKWRGIIDKPHTPVRAKRIIHLCMAGGPSQVETFDYKPKLKELDGKPFPESFTQGQQLAQLQGAKLIARGPFVDFHKHGESGQET